MKDNFDISLKKKKKKKTTFDIDSMSAVDDVNDKKAESTQPVAEVVPEEKALVAGTAKSLHSGASISQNCVVVFSCLHCGQLRDNIILCVQMISTLTMIFPAW